MGAVQVYIKRVNNNLTVFFSGVSPTVLCIGVLKASVF